MENKFKVGDRVALTGGGAYSNGEYVATISSIDANTIWLKETNTWAYPHEITHYGQTLADLNVKAGDVVECMEWFGVLHNKGDVVTYGDEWLSRGAGLWRIISRAADTDWNICEPDYTPQDNHEVSYHMGVATHWREVEAKEVDVERRVNVDREFDMYVTQNANATLRGKTLNGKPVGQWVIDMD